jgi:hypothetical protein
MSKKFLKDVVNDYGDKITLDLYKAMITDDAIVVSEYENQKHNAWLVGNFQVIAAELASGFGMGIFVYSSVEEYLDEHQDTWILEENKHETSMKNICSTLDINYAEYVREV